MSDLCVSGYTLRSSKIYDTVTLAFLSDLHGAEFGIGNQKLIREVKRFSPDAVLVGGDMLFERQKEPLKVPVALLRKLAAAYPVFAANGNHEHRLEILHASRLYRSSFKICGRKLYDEPVYEESLKRVYDEALRKAGVTLLENDSAIFRKGKTSVRIWGLDLDRKYFPKGRNIGMSLKELESYLRLSLKRVSEGEHFELLLAHHPNYLSAYSEWGADLVLAGHIHGGAVRVPVVGGLLSPNFTFFPKYSKGRYREGSCQMIVSAGLGAHTVTLRVNNPPDLVIVKLLPMRST